MTIGDRRQETGDIVRQETGDRRQRQRNPWMKPGMVKPPHPPLSGIGLVCLGELRARLETDIWQIWDTNLFPEPEHDLWHWLINLRLTV